VLRAIHEGVVDYLVKPFDAAAYDKMLKNVRSKIVEKNSAICGRMTKSKLNRKSNIIECFGFDRVVFGGDWPVVTQASEYTRWIKSLIEILKGVSKGDLHKLFYDNAVKFYRISC
jgi:predicted TIM-barrel fold metal-dependent hydrolase